MARNDIRIYDDNHPQGAEGHRVAAGATAIVAGEPVARALGSATVAALATNKPVVGTDFMVGICATDSTNTASAAGVVDVYPLLDGVTFVGRALNPTAVDTQAEYDAIVGDRVLFDLTAGAYKITNTDGATNGLVVMPMDITRYPGCIRFAFRQGASYLA